MATTFGDALKESLTALGGIRTKAEIAAENRPPSVILLPKAIPAYVLAPNEAQ
jgi:hypothetical protein